MARKIKHGGHGKHSSDAHAAMLYPSTTRKGDPTVRCTYPDKVVRCRNKDELEETLAFYSRPMIDDMVKPSKSNRLYYIQRIRPALRYFCKKYGVTIPKALEGNGRWEDYEPQTKLKIFGVQDFRTLEFPAKHLGK